ncbi:SDR family NAD(P)-dependent oxidoreductase [Paenibacillus sp. TRM 82003]|nr:SDR family NAD(P)-dependent oxidoreductase [Paenibacillus sp. TRM 82003]
MKAIIITGTSRGIGEATARLLLERGCRVVGIARRGNAALTGFSRYSHITADLGNADKLSGVAEEALAHIAPEERSAGMYWINNAAVLHPLRDAGEATPDEIAYHLQVNLTAPMILSSQFAKLTASWPREKRILNVSSASASFLLPGMSCYCTAKAGLDTFTKVMGLEQQRKAHPVRIASVWPGMIETEMQAEVRSQSADAFPTVEVFQGAKSNGMLTTPATAAEKLVALLFGEAFPQGGVVTDL